MTDMSNGTAWIDDAFADWDAESQEHCFKSHVYSDKLRARRAGTVRGVGSCRIPLEATRDAPGVLS